MFVPIIAQVRPKIGYVDKPNEDLYGSRTVEDTPPLTFSSSMTVEGTQADPVPLNNLVKASCDPSQPNGRDLALDVYTDIRQKVR